MNFSRAASLLAGSFVGLSAFTSSSLPLPIANGSTNVTLSVDTAVGRVTVPPGGSSAWWCDESGSNVYYTNGVSAGNWTGQSGHNYSLFAGDSGVVVYDRAASSTRWFFAGVSFAMFTGLFSVFCNRSLRVMVGGGLNE